jgi:ribokinase
VEGAVRAIGRAAGGFDWLLMPLETPLPAILAAAGGARRAGARVLLNPAPAPAQPLPAALLDLVDILAPNELEAAVLTGLPVDSDQQAETAAARLQELAPQARVLITRGGKGALALNQEAPAPTCRLSRRGGGSPPPEMFVAGLAVAMGEGLSGQGSPLRLRRRRPGRLPARHSLPQRQEVEAVRGKTWIHEGHEDMKLSLNL